MGPEGSAGHDWSVVRAGRLPGVTAGPPQAARIRRKRCPRTIRPGVLSHGRKRWTDLDRLIDGRDGLRLLIAAFPAAPNGAVIERHFTQPRAHGSRDAGYRLDQQNDFKPDKPSLVYIVTGSAFMAYVERQSQGRLVGFPLAHTLAATANAWINVIIEVEPVGRRLTPGVT